MALTNVTDEIGPGTLTESTMTRILNWDGDRRRHEKKKMHVHEVKEAKKRTVDNYWKKVIFTDECKVIIDGVCIFSPFKNFLMRV